MEWAVGQEQTIQGLRLELEMKTHGCKCVFIIDQLLIYNLVSTPIYTLGEYFVKLGD